MNSVNADAPRKCANCDSPSAIFRCSACKITKYCSKDCQTQHWKSIHKKQCKKIKQSSKTIGNTLRQNLMNIWKPKPSSHTKSSSYPLYDDHTTSIKTKSMQTNKTNISNVLCICGYNLIKSNHDDLNILCILCEIEWRNLFHCNQEYNIFHPDGYDICNKCVIKQNNATQPTQQPNNDNNIDIATSQIQHQHHCKHDIHCNILQQIIKIMNQFNADIDITKDMDTAQLTHIIDCYLHVLHEHDFNEQFKKIYHVLEPCDISKCVKFKRRNRNRMKNNDDDEEKKQQKENINVGTYILDTMHCYFYHSYDIGYRVFIEDLDNDEKKMDDDAFIQSQKKQNQQIQSQLDDKAYSKYNQLIVEETEDNMYQFGFIFVYDGESKIYPNSIVLSDQDAKYKSLKEEYMQNPFSVLTIDQYNNEYQKGLALFNSEYCKNNKDFQSDDVDLIFTVQHVLAMMIYCNYDKLQYEFSKTFRDNDGMDHTHFYHWGKYLKQCIYYFGQNASQSFYHGIDQKLYLPFYTGISEDIGFAIFGPLSTSSELSVAINFATINGLLIEFNTTGYSAKCLSLAWLSDFPQEKEYLFIHGIPLLKVVNVIEPKTGIEYNLILDALCSITNMYNPPERLRREASKQMIEMDESKASLIRAILSDELHKKEISGYQPFSSLTSFARQMINTYFFHGITNVHIHYWVWRKNFVDLLEFGVYKDYEGANLKILDALFPKLLVISIWNIKLSDALFENMLEYLTQIKTYNAPREISIVDINLKHSHLSIIEALNKYTMKYSKVSAFMYGHSDEILPNQWKINVMRIKSIDFIIMIIDGLFNKHSYIISDNMQKEIKALMQNTLDLCESNYHVLQNEFDAWCTEKKYIEIRWKIFAKNKQSFLFQLLYHKCFNFVKLNMIFPNMESLKLFDFPLHSYLIDGILSHLESIKTQKISEISIIPDGGSLNAMDIVEKYKEKFILNGWSVEEDCECLLITKTDIQISELHHALYMFE